MDPVLMGAAEPREGASFRRQQDMREVAHGRWRPDGGHTRGTVTRWVGSEVVVCEVRGFLRLLCVR